MEQVDTVLHEAVRYSDIHLVESALRDGLDPNAIGLYQWSPMHEAASNGDVDILKLLLKSTGNPNARDNLHGYTATHYAAKEDYDVCLQLLVDYGGLYDVTNYEGETPMDLATAGKCKEILENQCTADYIEQTLKGTRPSFDHHSNITYCLNGEDKSQPDDYLERENKDTLYRFHTDAISLRSSSPRNTCRTYTSPRTNASDHVTTQPRTSTPDCGSTPPRTNTLNCGSTPPTASTPGYGSTPPRTSPLDCVSTPLRTSTHECGSTPPRTSIPNCVSMPPRTNMPDCMSLLPRTNTPDYVSTLPRTRPSVAWDCIEVLESRDVPEAGTGLLQLSFEYNSRTSTLKIRIWQVEDLLLPPVEFANIGRIYVKSRLLPDKKGESKRRTEEHRLEDKHKMMNSLVTLKRKKARDSFKAIFLPCAFKFSKPLEYKKITKEMVASSTIHIDVCAKQKYSTKSFPIANIQLPLKTAVKKLRKERLQLHPCINYTMPDNVHVYDPKDLVIVTEGMHSNNIVSQPNLRTSSKQSMRDGKERHTTSDINLQTIRTLSVDSIPSVVDVPEERDDTEDILKEISVVGHLKSTSGLSHSEPQMTIVKMGEVSLPGSTDDELEEVKVIKSIHKISYSSPDVTVINVGEYETTFSNPKSHKLKLNRSSSPPKTKEVEKFRIESETISQKVKNSSTKQAVDKLQQVTVATPKRTFQRKSKEQLAEIELKDLEEPKSRYTELKPRLHRSTSPPNKLFIPGIRVVDTETEQTSVVSIDKEEVAKDRNLYQKRKKHDTPKPGHVVDLRLMKDVQKESSESEKCKGKLTLSNSEELSVGQRFTPHTKTRTDYTEITELTSRGTGFKTTSSSEVIGDLIQGRHCRQVAGTNTTARTAIRKHNISLQARMKSPNSITQETTTMIRQQDFPQTLTNNMMHSELNPLPNFKDKTDRTRGNQSISPDVTQMHYVSETQKTSPKKTKHNSTVKKKELAIKVPSQKVRTSDMNIEMTKLILDPAQLATSNFKLKQYQKTGNDLHPSMSYFPKTESEGGLSHISVEEMDPFCVPGTQIPPPLQYPVSYLGSPCRDVSPVSKSSVKNMSQDENNVSSSGIT